jgi:hypothetical protein
LDGAEEGAGDAVLVPALLWRLQIFIPKAIMELHTFPKDSYTAARVLKMWIGFISLISKIEYFWDIFQVVMVYGALNSFKISICRIFIQKMVHYLLYFLRTAGCYTRRGSEGEGLLSSYFYFVHQA